jgi:hypothetical protein
LAKVKAAQSERRAAEITAEATVATTRRYMEIARSLAGPDATWSELVPIVMKFASMDNTERIVAQGGAVNIIEGAIPIIPNKQV